MKRTLRTKICDMLGIEYPIILAGMGRISRAELVAAVSNAGGLGVIGGGRMLPEELRDEIRKTRELTDKPFGVNLLLPAALPETSTRDQLEVQLPELQLAFVEKLKRDLGLPKVDMSDWRGLLGSGHVRKLVEVTLEEKVPVFSSGLGDPGWLVPDAHAQGMKVIALVGNVRNAVRVAGSGVDIIVAQGHEAGGHTGRIATMPLIPMVVDAVSPLPVLAAGGIADGRGLVASLALGASGVWCGTVFMVTHEANVEEYPFVKERIIEATEEDTRLQRFYTGKTQRYLKNKLIEAWEQSGVPPLPMPLQGLLMAELLAGLQQAGRRDYLAGPAGQICGMLKEVKGAGQVVEEMVEGAVEILSRTLPAEVIAR